MPQKVLWKPMVFKLNFLSSRIGVRKLKYTSCLSFSDKKDLSKITKNSRIPASSNWI